RVSAASGRAWSRNGPGVFSQRNTLGTDTPSEFAKSATDIPACLRKRAMAAPVGAFGSKTGGRALAAVAFFDFDFVPLADLAARFFGSPEAQDGRASCWGVACPFLCCAPGWASFVFLALSVRGASPVSMSIP